MGLSTECGEFGRLHVAVETAREAVACRILGGAGRQIDERFIERDSTVCAEEICGELEEKLEQLHPSVFFSHELCARYFTYMSRESGAHFVLFDDRDTLRKKLEVAQELGITSAVAALPEVLDAAGELGIRN